MKFEIQINEEKIHKIMNPNGDASLKNNISSDLSEIKPVVSKLVDPEGYYTTADQKIYVVVTLGKQIDTYAESLWTQNNYFMAMLHDQLLIQLLFDLSSEMYQHLREQAIFNNHGLSKRLTPGDELDLIDNLSILDHIESPVKCNEYAVLMPTRSLAYMYLIQDGFECNEDINCGCCSNKSCYMRIQNEN